VYFTARSQSKADAAIADLLVETRRRAEFLQLDLSDLAKVRASADDFLRRAPAIDALILNAGVMHPPIEEMSAQGWDAQFATNVLGHFLFIKLLIPLLRATASSATAPSRIVWLSSSTQFYFSEPTVNYDTITDSPARTKLGSFLGLRKPRATYAHIVSNNDAGIWQLYAQSKYAVVLLCFKLSKLLQGELGAGGKVICICVDPGMFRHACSSTLTVVNRTAH
jgi:retinol dehydrogenase 12